MDTAVTAFLALGSNLGDRAENLRQACAHLDAHPAIRLIQCSHFYETAPVGDLDQGWFLNAALRIETSLTPRELLTICLETEQLLGRVRDRQRRNGPRTLDVDVLFYGDMLIQEEGLEIPHPRLHERTFVLTPLVEIAPTWVHPVLHKTIAELNCRVENLAALGYQ